MPPQIVVGVGLDPTQVEQGLNRLQARALEFQNAIVASFKKADDAVNSIKGALVTTSFSMQNLGVIVAASGAAIAGTMLAGVDAAIKFESAFAGVKKTMELSNPEFAALAKTFRQMSLEIPVTAVELSRIGEIAGQLGVRGGQNIQTFVDTIAKVTVATRLTGEQAAIAFARLSAVMGEPIQNVSRMASAVVNLGNNFAATEGDILAIADRLGAAGKIAGFTTPQILGIGAALRSVGINAELGGTAIQRVMIALTESVATADERLALFAQAAGKTIPQFVALFKTSPFEAFKAVIEGIGRAGQSSFGLLTDLFGHEVRLTQAVLALSNAGDRLNQTVFISNQGWQQNNAHTAEAAKRFETAESQLKLLWNRVVNIGITIGDTFLPAIKAAAAATGDLLNFLGRHETLLQFAGAIGLILGGTLTAGGGLLILVGQLGLAARGVIELGRAFTAFAATTAGLRLLTFAAALFSPEGLMIAGVLAAAAAVGVMIIKWNEWVTTLEQTAKKQEDFNKEFERLKQLNPQLAETFKSLSQQLEQTFDPEKRKQIQDMLDKLKGMTKETLDQRKGLVEFGQTFKDWQTQAQAGFDLWSKEKVEQRIKETQREYAFRIQTIQGEIEARKVQASALKITRDEELNLITLDLEKEREAAIARYLAEVAIAQHAGTRKTELLAKAVADYDRAMGEIDKRDQQTQAQIAANDNRTFELKRHNLNAVVEQLRQLGEIGDSERDRAISGFDKERQAFIESWKDRNKEFKNTQAFREELREVELLAWQKYFAQVSALDADDTQKRFQNLKALHESLGQILPMQTELVEIAYQKSRGDLLKLVTEGFITWDDYYKKLKQLDTEFYKRRSDARKADFRDANEGRANDARNEEAQLKTRIDNLQVFNDHERNMKVLRDQLRAEEAIDEGDFRKFLVAQFDLQRDRMLTGYREIGAGILSVFQNAQRSISDIFFKTVKGEITSFEDVWKSLLDSMLHALSDFLASQVVKQALNFFSSLFGGSGAVSLSGFASSIFTAASGGLAGIGNFFGKLLTGFGTDTVPALLTPGEAVLNEGQQQTLTGFIDALGNFFGGLGGRAADLGASGLGQLEHAFETLKGFFGGGSERLVEGIRSVINDPLGAATRLGGSAVDAVSTFGGRSLQLVSGKASDLFNGIVGMPANLLAVLQDQVGGIAANFSAGKTVFEGIMNVLFGRTIEATTGVGTTVSVQASQGLLSGAGASLLGAGITSLLSLFGGEAGGLFAGPIGAFISGAALAPSIVTAAGGLSGFGGILTGIAAGGLGGGIGATTVAGGVAATLGAAAAEAFSAIASAAGGAAAGAGLILPFVAEVLTHAFTNIGHFPRSREAARVESELAVPRFLEDLIISAGPGDLDALIENFNATSTSFHVDDTGRLFGGREQNVDINLRPLIDFLKSGGTFPNSVIRGLKDRSLSRQVGLIQQGYAQLFAHRQTPVEALTTLLGSVRSHPGGQAMTQGDFILEEAARGALSNFERLMNAGLEPNEALRAALGGATGDDFGIAVRRFEHTSTAEDIAKLALQGATLREGGVTAANVAALANVSLEAAQAIIDANQPRFILSNNEGDFVRFFPTSEFQLGGGDGSSPGEGGAPGSPGDSSSPGGQGSPGDAGGGEGFVHGGLVRGVVHGQRGDQRQWYLSEDEFVVRAPVARENADWLADFNRTGMLPAHLSGGSITVDMRGMVVNGIRDVDEFIRNVAPKIEEALARRVQRRSGVSGRTVA